MTYTEIIVEVIKQTGREVKDCWIAEVKEQFGLTRGPAPNRGKGRGASPCPMWARIAIEQVLREKGEIR